MAAPACAQDLPPLPPVSAAAPMQAAAHPALPSHDTAAYDRARTDWLRECRRRHGSGKTVGGAVAGGLVGGLLGNRVAGRGDRTEGTIIGAAVGAAVGGAIGNAADSSEARDYCQSYLDQYASYSHGGYGHGYAYAMQPMMVMVPVAMVQAAAPAAAQDCKETVVTEEWDEVVPSPRARAIRRPVSSKRVRAAPDKRTKLY